MADDDFKKHSESGTNFLQRLVVPDHFPQFRNAAALAHLAHCRRGPRYVLVGGIAWYDPIDINRWLEGNKKTGPAKFAEPQHLAINTKPKTGVPRKRGRPTKLEQMVHKRLSRGASGG